jgi:hypothetical protein
LEVPGIVRCSFTLQLAPFECIGVDWDGFALAIGFGLDIAPIFEDWRSDGVCFIVDLQNSLGFLSNPREDKLEYR